MNKLWAPWRMDYIRTPKEDGCVFCTKHQSKKDKGTGCVADPPKLCVNFWVRLILRPQPLAARK